MDGFSVARFCAWIAQKNQLQSRHLQRRYA